MGIYASSGASSRHETFGDDDALPAPDDTDDDSDDATDGDRPVPLSFPLRGAHLRPNFDGTRPLSSAEFVETATVLTDCHDSIDSRIYNMAKMLCDMHTQPQKWR